jgi:Mn2+/Fe2+ NRAMP family transporter
VLTALLVQPDWRDLLRATVVPSIRLEREWLLTFVAICGTTISPYLFFWQADEEVEEEKERGRTSLERRLGASPAALRNAAIDVIAGMTISVLIFYFIIVATGATLHAAGLHDIQTAEQAARALEPLAGRGAALLFSLGIIGTGLLGVSVLAGAAALAVAEAAEWNAGMSEPLSRAVPFYAVLITVIAAGTLLSFLQISPIRMLFVAAVLNGVLAPPLIAVVLTICNDRRVMGDLRNGRILNLLGAAAALVMSAGALALLLL